MVIDRIFASVVLWFAALLLSACGSSEPGEVAAGGKGPVVLAAASMQEVLADVSAAWVAGGHDAPVISTAASSALARQIEQGAPADLFISADLEWMDKLAEGGLLRAGTRANIAGNRLVLIGAADGGTNSVALVPGVIGKMLGDGRLAMAEPATVPAGRYGHAALQALGLWGEVEQRVAAAENVRAALALVERGQAPLGIVYATDAQTAPAVHVRAIFPENTHPPIVYPVAVLAASDHADAAAFRSFLSSGQAAGIFARHGFSPPSAP